MPGTIMAMGRLNRPSIMIYGGTIKPGHFQGNSYDIVSAFQIGGTPGVIRFLLEEGFLDGDCMTGYLFTVTGKTLAENAKLFPALSEGQVG
ncbi:hypothetical protein BHE74_00020641 [Ensete ventricosum]|uniref:Dihydroxy-acid/6-phosphogluconate dehydratase N-terminal domain-containing protein n=1 Tax=Ensete ventricosum TaxID=4639 RepID=A0A444CLX4_ENSVE|nr:hypothetical protein B296_00000600 [Ensete ventricosum]RWV86879.1 hypothetical protein GW17_00051180 [Ensete ventricosum]RWW71609.1 hypothetical protein BHE74_00020641 [Ensete ventricosum]RZR90357.1 hypothetical protein BHM03_00018223 [Ensete ventricosum]